jgi:eukaryotic-like serine/threonine-protein kinase
VTPERYQQIARLYHATLEKKSGERVAFLDRACGADAELRREVESLIASDEQAESFIEAPALEVAAGLLAQDQAASVIGRQVSHYQVLSLLGAGGMGEVYLAEDALLGRKAALKLLPLRFTQDRELVRRFEQEARAASSLNHPNIITIYEIGHSDELYFIATEFIEGQTLRQRLAGGPVPLGEALEVAIQAASALAAAHQAGIAHRDIKPENIMLRPDGIVKVLDFGLAKLTEKEEVAAPPAHPSSLSLQPSTTPGLVLGTLTYMSPEQARGQKVDERTDVFSLGVVFYEMIAGRTPFAGATQADVIAAILDKEPEPLARSRPEVPEALDRFIAKALRKDRADRYQSGAELLAALKTLRQQLDSGAVVARRASSAEFLLGQFKQHRRAALFALAALIALTLALFYYTRPAPVLTEKDTILLADFENRTGEAVFDGALKQGLAVQLGQSPFLSILPEARVKETLRLMGRAGDAQVTPDIAREICLRQGLKAFIKGSIAPLGSHYVITLEAVNAEADETIAREQIEAGAKEQVLGALGRTATSLRDKLGESLASIKQFDTPIERATTPSLDALKNYSLGMAQVGKGLQGETILALFRRAIELDPHFALCYRDLAREQFYLGRRQEAMAAGTRAFELRERAGEYERFSIEVFYYNFVTHELDKSIETAELWKHTYPRAWRAYHSLADLYIETGQFEKAVENGREAVRLNPDYAPAYTNPAGALVALTRFAEAKVLYRQAMARNLNHPAFHFYPFWMAYAERDEAAMQREIDWLRANDYEFWALLCESQRASLRGKWRESLALSRRTEGLVEQRGMRTWGAFVAAIDANTAALLGDCRTATQRAAQVFALTQSNREQSFALVALALCGEERRAQRLADELASRFPQDIVLQGLRLPTVRAAIELQRGQPDRAMIWLDLTKRHEGVHVFFGTHLRGLAYLQQGASAEAAAEFQKIREHPGWFMWTPLLPLSRLWEARAHARAGNIERSRQAYAEFFDLWKDADADLPLLRAARRELASLH